MLVQRVLNMLRDDLYHYRTLVEFTASLREYLFSCHQPFVLIMLVYEPSGGILDNCPKGVDMAKSLLRNDLSNMRSHVICETWPAKAKARGCLEDLLKMNVKR